MTKQKQIIKGSKDIKTFQVFKTQKCRTQTIGLNVFQTILNDDFHPFIFFELKPGFGNFRNAWIQLDNFYGKLRKMEKNELFYKKATITL